MQEQPGQVPAAPDADYSQCKTNYRAEDGHETGIRFEADAHYQHGCSGQRGGGVDIGAKDRWDAGEQDVTNRATAHPGHSSHQNCNEWMDAEIEGFGCAGDG